MDELESEYAFKKRRRYQEQRIIIKKVLSQQEDLFYHGVKPQNRTISLFKPYLRPIVRGKETKKAEFGAKINKIQIDGISFIQCLSFDPFNECTTFEDSINQARQLTGIRIEKVGAATIYAINANRKFATSSGIKTDFVHKGRAGQDEQERKKIARVLRKERASSLEGSFGNEKEHYCLKRIRARTEKTEILWIFFGIHTANAVQIGHRMSAARSMREVA